jgi:hypothetical protein
LSAETAQNSTILLSSDFRHFKIIIVSKTQRLWCSISGMDYLEYEAFMDQLPESTELEPKRKKFIEFVRSSSLERVREILSQIKA